MTGKTIRVALVVPSFDVGGMERCAVRLANRLDRARFQPMVICLSRSGTASQWIRRDDVPVVELHKPVRNDARTIWRLSKMLRYYRIDLAHSHNIGTLMETTLARRWAGVPGHVHAQHGHEHDYLQASYWRRQIRLQAVRWALRRVDTVVTVAKSVLDHLVSQYGYRADRAYVVPNGVDPIEDGDFRARGTLARRSLQIPENALVLGSVGRLEPVKDFGMAIEAIALMVSEGSNVHLILVGSGSESNSLRAQAAAAVPHNVHFVSQQRNIGDWLGAMDVYVNSSLSEGMSLSILEAMSAGLPVVATDVGDNRVLVGGSRPCGVIVTPGAAKPLARALAQLLTNPNAREEFGCRGRERFQQLYNAHRMVNRYEDVYAAISHQRQTPV